MYREIALKFKVPYEYLDSANAIRELLTEQNIKYCFYESNGYYAHEFTVRKTGRTWNYIMGIINKIYAPKYRREATYFNEEGLEYSEVTYL